MTDDDRLGGFTPLRATKFYIPLLLQAFSQSLTYPLVAAIVTHGPWGVDTLTPFAQGQTLMFMIGSLSGGILTTGMVYARNRTGYETFKRLNAAFMAVLLSIQMLAAFPGVGGWIFTTLLGLPEHMVGVARQTLLWGAIMHGGFFLRNVPLVALLNARASFEANAATFVRIVVTAACTPLFISLGWTGAAWGLVAMTVGCFIELALSWWFARPHVRALKAEGEHASSLKQFAFTMPLSLGAFMLASAPFMVAAFVGRSAGGVSMVAIHYVTMGLAAPVCFGALRMQTVAIQFPPEYDGDVRVKRYAAYAGLVLGILPLLVAIPALSRWYFGVVQNMHGDGLVRAQIVIALYSLWPIVQSLRGHAEGIAAWRRRPNVVLVSQVVYLASLSAALAATLAAGLPGWLMGVTSIMAASLAALGALRILLR
jgi:hypothetical protein